MTAFMQVSDAFYGTSFRFIKTIGGKKKKVFWPLEVPSQQLAYVLLLRE